MNTEIIKNKIKSAGLKVTPQRLAVLDALLESRNHPTAEMLIKIVQKKHPYIAVGTIYNILDTFVKHGLVEKVFTENNVVRYDAFMDGHFHILDGDEIKDFYDEKLFRIIKTYLSGVKIPDFELEDFEIILKGKFISGKVN